MTSKGGTDLETDDRFPTGEWDGFWLQRPQIKDRQLMDLSLTFARGRIHGDGRDSVGQFTMTGRYDVKSGKVVIHKQYVGAHLVIYEGWAEIRKGIWGVWNLPGIGKDGFHIWPRGMGDPTQVKHASTSEDAADADETPILVESVGDAGE